MSFAIGELIAILIIAIGIIYIWKKEKQNKGRGFRDSLYLGAILIIIGVLTGTQPIMTFGLLFLLAGFIGKLFRNTNQVAEIP